MTLTGDSAANRLEGGDGFDVIRGGAGADDVRGGADNDLVIGGDGADLVEAGTGSDRLFGNAGDDSLSDGEVNWRHPDVPDTLACGQGNDGVFSGASDTLSPACEGLHAASARFRTHPVLRGDRVEYAAACRYSFDDPCSGTLALHSLAGEEYGKVDFDMPPQRRTTVLVPLTPAGIAAVRAGAVIRVDVIASAASSPSGGYRMPLRPQ